MPRTRRAVGLKVTESATQSIVLSVPKDLKVPTVRRWSAGRRSPREQPGVAGRSGGRRGQTWATGMEPLSQPAGRGEPPPGWSILCVPGRAVPVPFLSLGIPAVAMSRARESRREAGDVLAVSLFHRACIIRRR